MEQEDGSILIDDTYNEELFTPPEDRRDEQVSEADLDAMLAKVKE